MGREVMAGMSVLFLILFLSFSSCKVSFAATTTSSLHKQNLSTPLNPFSPRASLIRYWNKHISNSLPKPLFLLSKASPLSAIDSAILTKLATQNSLSLHLDSFCSLANLFCFFDTKQSLRNHDQDSNFALYSNKRFANYGGSRLSGVDSFKNYSNGLNTVADSFIRYSRESTGHSETFTNYGNDGNVANATFGNYGSAATGGSGTFKNYDNRVNVPGLRFTTYASDGNDHKLSFSSYSDETNVGAQGFNSYGKKGNGVPSEFVSYSRDSNGIESKFTGYGELGNAANDSFTSYGNSGNNPHNNFKSYGSGANSAIDRFSSYRNGANVGQDSFQSYAKDSNSGKVSFANYGKSFNPGNDSFIDYGKGSKGMTTIGFKSYSLDRSFVVYKDKGVTFAGYSNTSSMPSENGVSVKKRWVEPGKFFRESMLKQGNVMVMPDIRDKMPERSFLPRSIVSKLPFSTTNMAKLKDLFHASANSTMTRVLINALAECERVPSHGETKRCVGSVEDMIDFAVSVLGHNVTVRTTENVNGSKKRVMIGSVEGINGGQVTKSVSCHQSLYPYLLYYCHSVPRVRVYEADIVDVEKQEQEQEQKKERRANQKKRKEKKRMGSSAAIRELQRDLENKANDLSKLQKDIAKNHQVRKKYTIQLGENELVLKELDLLNEGANVYKLIGPVLVKQDLAEANANVSKRIEYISAELKRLDGTLQDLEEKQNSKKDAIFKLQQRIQSFQAGKAKA